MTLEASIDAAPVSPRPALSIPVLDLGGEPEALVSAFRRGCQAWGLVHVVGHGVPGDLSEAVREASRRFFALPAAQKRTLARTLNNPWGYYDRELTKNRRDRKEIFDIPHGLGADAADPFADTAVWPPEPPDFAPVMQRHLAACEALSSDLLSILAASLEIAPRSLARHFRPSHSSFLRLNFYPVHDALETELGKSDLGIHHHTDAGALTVLLQDEVSGLQVFREGVWYDIEPVEGALTVNIGDLVQVWSNDRYPAPVHRVRGMTRQDRYSAAYFYNPSYAAVIAPETAERPALYRPFSWREFRMGRAEGDFGDYGQEVQIADYRIQP